MMTSKKYIHIKGQKSRFLDFSHSAENCYTLLCGDQYKTPIKSVRMESIQTCIELKLQNQTFTLLFFSLDRSHDLSKVLVWNILNISTYLNLFYNQHLENISEFHLAHVFSELRHLQMCILNVFLSSIFFFFLSYWRKDSQGDVTGSDTNYQPCKSVLIVESHYYYIQNLRC